MQFFLLPILAHFYAPPPLQSRVSSEVPPNLVTNTPFLSTLFVPQFFLTLDFIHQGANSQSVQNL